MFLLEKLQASSSMQDGRSLFDCRRLRRKSGLLLQPRRARDELARVWPDSTAAGVVKRCGGYGGAYRPQPVLQLHATRGWRSLTSGLASQVSSSSDSCWAKASRGRQLLQRLLAAAPAKGQSELEEGLFAMLRDDHRDTKPAAAHGYRLGDDRTGAAFETYRYDYGAGLLTQLARFDVCGFLTIGLLGAGSGTHCGLRSQFSCLRRSSIERDALLYCLATTLASTISNAPTTTAPSRRTFWARAAGLFRYGVGLLVTIRRFTRS